MKKVNIEYLSNLSIEEINRLIKYYNDRLQSIYWIIFCSENELKQTSFSKAEEELKVLGINETITKRFLFIKRQVPNEEYEDRFYQLAEQIYNNSDFSEINEFKRERSLINRKVSILQEEISRRTIVADSIIFNSKEEITNPNDVHTGELPIKKENNFTRKRKRNTR